MRSPARFCESPFILIECNETSMHAAERETHILDAVRRRGFISFQDLESQIPASAATIRRDLKRLMNAGLLTRVHGGAKRADTRPSLSSADTDLAPHLLGTPLALNMNLNVAQKAAIGKAAAKLCNAKESIMIDGGSSTFHMCRHLAGLDLQVLSNSLPIVLALLQQRGTRVLVPAGQVFPEQNIILSLDNDDGMPSFHAPKLFMGGAALGPSGLMQIDMLLVAAERRLMDRADKIIVLLDSSKFDGPSGHVVCALQEIDIVVTDKGITPKQKSVLHRANIKVVIA
jgi:DeoR family transcriptional regulator, ulaG and ulaABCDEF operon transcriptional repressor